MDPGYEETQVKSESLWETGVGGTWIVKPLKGIRCVPWNSDFPKRVRGVSWRVVGDQGVGGLKWWKTLRKFLGLSLRYSIEVKRGSCKVGGYQAVGVIDWWKPLQKGWAVSRSKEMALLMLSGSHLCWKLYLNHCSPSCSPITPLEGLEASFYLLNLSGSL